MLAARDGEHAEGFIAFRAGDDRPYARQLRGLGHIDFENFAMRIGAAEDASRQRPGRNEVGGIFRPPRNLFGPVDHRHVGANRVARADLAHGATPAALSAAAYFTASMIFT